MKYVVCNFKNKLVLDDIVKYSNRIEGISYKKSELVIMPTVAYLPCFSKKGYSLGSQDITSFIDRTITGEVTGEQLKSLGCEYVLVGHSERREYKKEINIDFINKINNAQESGLKVIYCIGETLDDKEKFETFNVLEKQISEVLNNVDIRNIIIAYEPVWAIGTGNTPSKVELANVIEYIKDTIQEKYNTDIKVLYGGSVDALSFDEIYSNNIIDGFLIGSYSLDANKVIGLLKKIENN